jgi:ankyrin repeat protein
LLEAGADRHIEDERNMLESTLRSSILTTSVLTFNRSATQKAWEYIFTGHGSSGVIETYKVLFPNDDIEYWMFSPLHKAVLGIEGQNITRILEDNTGDFDINAIDIRGRTALHWAALRGDLTAAEILLDAGAAVDAVDESNSTPLLYAVSSGTPRILEVLVLRGAKVNAVNNQKNTPLNYAARKTGNIQAVRILVQAGARLDHRNGLGNTPFAGAAITNETEIGNYLIEKGADKYSRNKYGDTPLRETVHHNSHEFLIMLLDSGTRYDDVNKSGSSILHALALEGDISTLQILRTANMAGLDTQLRNINGYTAMDICRKRISASVEFKDMFTGLISTLEPDQRIIE